MTEVSIEVGDIVLRRADATRISLASLRGRRVLVLVRHRH